MAKKAGKKTNIRAWMLVEASGKPVVNADKQMWFFGSAKAAKFARLDDEKVERVTIVRG